MASLGVFSSSGSISTDHGDNGGVVFFNGKSERIPRHLTEAPILPLPCIYICVPTPPHLLPVRFALGYVTREPRFGFYELRCLSKAEFCWA